MKNIPNRTFTIKLAENSDKLATTASLLALTLNSPPQGGFDLATMRARARVQDALATVRDGGEITLEDADHTTARACVESFKWGALHADIVKFAEQFGL